MSKKKIKINEMRVKDNHISTFQFLAFYDKNEAEAELEEIREASRGTRFEHDFDEVDCETSW